MHVSTLHQCKSVLASSSFSIWIGKGQVMFFLSSLGLALFLGVIQVQVGCKLFNSFTLSRFSFGSSLKNKSLFLINSRMTKQRKTDFEIDWQKHLSIPKLYDASKMVDLSLKITSSQRRNVKVSMSHQDYSSK